MDARAEKLKALFWETMINAEPKGIPQGEERADLERKVGYIAEGLVKAFDILSSPAHSVVVNNVITPAKADGAPTSAEEIRSIISDMPKKDAP